MTDKSFIIKICLVCNLPFKWFYLSNIGHTCGRKECLKQVDKLRNFNMGEALILSALTSLGFSKKQLKDKLVKFGDIGTLGEWALKNKTQTGIGDFF
jgi:hypothetical protein